MKVSSQPISSLLMAAIIAGAATIAWSQESPATTSAAPPRQQMDFGMGPPATDEQIAKVNAMITQSAPGPFEPTWESIKTNYKVPAWYNEAKLGITMHWGLYSVPAYHNEWYAKHMYNAFVDWHAKNFGPQDKFGYKDFIPLFKAEKFDADEWAAICKSSGAGYVMPTCEHHDGFSLWDSQVNPFNSMKMGPNRDIMGELSVAIRKQGMKFGICDHSIENYTFIKPKKDLVHDLDDPKYAEFYWFNKTDQTLQTFLKRWVNKSYELIDKYQPDIIWFDNGANSRVYDPLKLKIAAYYYNRAKEWKKEVTLDTKSTCYLAGSVLDFEKMVRGPKDILPGVWEAEEPIGSTWGYTNDEKFRSPQSIVNLLCDVVSKGGNLLLNLSPAGDGSINEAQKTTLKELGDWLKINGEAIYGTHAWKRFSDTDSATNYRFTVKGDALYAIALNWPGTTATIPSLTKNAEGKIARVTMLGNEGDLGFKQDADGLTIQLPNEKGKYAYVFKIEGLATNPPGEMIPAIMPPRQENNRPATQNRNNQ